MAEARPVVLVTGACGGLGRSLVERFHCGGYSVLALDVQPPQHALPGHFLPCDLRRVATDPAAMDELVHRVSKHAEGNPLAGLINNAAVQMLGPAESLDRTAWNESLQVNLLAPFFLTQALLPLLEGTTHRPCGSVVNISSIHAHLTKPGFAAYATTKAALSGMTRALAVDLGGRVRVNAIEPAAIDTPMLREGFAGLAPCAMDELCACHPSGCIGTPQEFAELAFWLVDGPGFVHGSCISLDGGIRARLHDPQ